MIFIQFSIFKRSGQIGILEANFLKPVRFQFSWRPGIDFAGSTFPVKKNPFSLTTKFSQQSRNLTHFKLLLRERLTVDSNFERVRMWHKCHYIIYRTTWRELLHLMLWHRRFIFFKSFIAMLLKTLNISYNGARQWEQIHTNAWLNLPHNLKHIHELVQFKSSLKTFLVNKSSDILIIN